MASLNPSFSSTTSCSNREWTPYVQFLQVLIQHRCLVFHCFKIFFPIWHIFLFLAFYGISWRILSSCFLFFPVALSCCLIHWFFSRLIKLSLQPPTQAVWQDGNNHLRESGCIWCCLRLEAGEDVLRFLPALCFCHFHYLSSFALIYFIWPHDPKFSKALKYMSMFILSKKVVRNELGSHWNDFWESQ